MAMRQSRTRVAQQARSAQGAGELTRLEPFLHALHVKRVPTPH